MAKRRPGAGEAGSKGARRKAGASRQPGGAFQEVWQWVRRIPRGRVMTYGQISELLGRTLSPAAVGWAMNGCPDNVPWQRVVNARGGCSTDQTGKLPGGLQQAMLEEEGVAFGADGTLDLERYRYRPRSTRSRPRSGPGTSRRRGTSREC